MWRWIYKGVPPTGTGGLIEQFVTRIPANANPSSNLNQLRLHCFRRRLEWVMSINVIHINIKLLTQNMPYRVPNYTEALLAEFLLDNLKKCVSLSYVYSFSFINTYLIIDVFMHINICTVQESNPRLLVTLIGPLN